jgi:hypothetical protein
MNRVNFCNDSWTSVNILFTWSIRCVALILKIFSFYPRSEAPRILATMRIIHTTNYNVIATPLILNMLVTELNAFDSLLLYRKSLKLVKIHCSVKVL